MALAPCRECGAQVSTEAQTCPHCGVARPAGAPSPPLPEQPTRAARSLSQQNGCRRPLVVIGIIVAALWLIGSLSGPQKSTTDDAVSVQAKAATDAACMDDLRCIAEKNSVGAAIKCAPLVERLAKNNFEWIDKWYEQKFSHYRWKDRANRIVTFVGDRIKYQNGFGAWTLSIYECDFDTRSNTVLDVRARAGQLPQ